MKNILLVVLVGAVGLMGYLLISQNNSTEESNSNNSTNNTTRDSQSRSGGSTINLSSEGLTEVPKDILDDTTVTVLDVSNNNLTSALPAEIRKLTNLEQLLANDNNMTGIPAEIGQLSKLRIANFANNDLSGLPLEIGNLKNLETLDLRGNPNISEFDLNQIRSNIPNATILTD